MALDTIQVTEGAGAGITVDDCGGSGNVQVVKPAFGIEGSITLASATNPLPVVDASHVGSTWTKTTANSSASTGVLLAANANRKAVRIRNTDANALIIAEAATAALTNVIRLATNDIWISDPCSYKGAIAGIWEADGAGVACVEELA